MNTELDKELIAESLIKYRDSRANEVIKSRARGIYLEEPKINNFSYQFRYKGTKKTPYKISIFINGKIINTDCTCPYEQSGLCKHLVAGINYLLNHNFNSENNLPNEFKNRQQTLDLLPEVEKGVMKLPDNLIDDKVIKDALKANGLKNLPSFENYSIEVIELPYIGLLYQEHWDSHFIKIEYNSQHQSLKTHCTCRSTKSLCSHRIGAIAYLKNLYNERLFQPNFVDKQIENHLDVIGYDSLEEVKQLFTFELNENGIGLKPKIKGFFGSLNETPKILTQMKESQFTSYLPKVSQSTPYKVGICIQAENYDSDFEIYPFKAKTKKNEPETLYTHFKLLNEEYFMDLKEDLEEEHYSLIVKFIRFNHNFQKLERNPNFTLTDFEKLHQSFQELLDLSADLPLFYKDDTRKLSRNTATQIKFEEERVSLSFSLTNKPNYLYTLTPSLKIGEEIVRLKKRGTDFQPFYCMHNSRFYLYEKAVIPLTMGSLFFENKIVFHKKDYQKMMDEFVIPLSKNFDFHTDLISKKKTLHLEETACKSHLYLTDYEGEYVVFEPAIEYSLGDAKKIVPLYSKEKLYDENKNKEISRNWDLENELNLFIQDLHPDFESQENVYFLEPYQLIENNWLLSTSEKLKNNSVEIFGAKDLKSFKYNLNPPTISMQTESGLDWFDLLIDVNFGDTKASLKDVRKAIINKSKYVSLSDGTLGILPEKWIEKFSKLFVAGEVQNKGIKVSNYQFNILDELNEELEETPEFLMELLNKKQRLLNLTQIEEVVLPKKLKATLRPYQIEGLRWLSFLDENQLGGCLADDMGLGKTLQVISFFAHLKETQKVKTPHLVVAPTSLIFNWQEEIEKFYPNLKVCIYTGNDRQELVSKFKNYDVILTTYGLVLRDIETLKEKKFHYVVLDESQAIKNPNSKRYKAVRLLQCHNRLALTGTPIENNTFDLYAQMNFLNPGIFGSMNHFKTQFSNAIDKDKNKEISTLLSAIIQPFMLRRTKEKVATELPEKTESIMYCEMGSEQRKIYEHFKEKYRDYILNKMTENGVEKSQMYVLEGLTKLRQICNSPALLKEKEDFGKPSVKLEMLIENIKSKTAQHKILVFSQFTSMLSLIKEQLDVSGIKYEYLDGTTRNRKEKVDNFQESDDIRVFLISLKAGGTGLNLTSADYVFLVDPWWNPAVENQAIDRSYRIGQKNHVVAYKMICKDTIEEKIIKLQEGKKQISSDIIQVDGVKKSFDQEKIKELFA